MLKKNHYFPILFSHFIFFHVHTTQVNENIIYSTELYDLNIQKALDHTCYFFGKTDFYLYLALDDLSSIIKGKNVAVLGSSMGWYESILLAYGANPIVINSTAIETTDPRVTYLTPEQYLENPQQFDLILSITNIPCTNLECDEDLNEDLKIMETLKKMLAVNGKLLLAAPVGQNHITSNKQNVYDEKKLKKLLNGWKIIRYYGFSSENLFNDIEFRPIFLLKAK